MPIYEYECTDCGERFERLRRLADPPLTECPQCGGVVKKMLSAPAFQFKGTGWYVTDYARKDQAKADGDGKESSSESSGDSSSSDSSAKSSGTSSESKPKSSPKPDSSGSSTKDS